MSFSVQMTKTSAEKRIYRIVLKPLPFFVHTLVVCFYWSAWYQLTLCNSNVLSDSNTQLHTSGLAYSLRICAAVCVSASELTCKSLFFFNVLPSIGRNTIKPASVLQNFYFLLAMTVHHPLVAQQLLSFLAGN